MKLLLLDGNSIMNSSYYGMPPLTTSDGILTNAVVGTMNVLLKYLEELRPDYACVAFDVKAPTFRHKKASDYKAGRKPMPDDLRGQFPLVKECIKACGIKVVEAEGYEADDIIGTCSAFVRGKEDSEAYIITGDRDSFQLIRDNVKVIYKNPKGIRIIDRAAFGEEYPGITPETFVAYKALAGDSSDNIHGVAGVGNKTALALVSEYKSVSGIYENIGNIKGSVKTKLENDRESAFLSEFLAEIKVDAPIFASAEDIKTVPPDIPLCEEKFLRLQMARNLEVVKRLASDVPVVTEICYPMPENIPPLGGGYAKLGDKIALFRDGNVIYDGENRVTVTEEDISRLLSDESKTVIVTDSKAEHSKYPVRCSLFDVSLAAYVINSSSKEATIPGLCLEYFKKEAGANGRYDGAKLMFDIAAEQKKLLEESRQTYVYEKIELPLAKVLAEMEKVGFRVDLKGLEQFSGELEAMCEDYTAKIYSMAGHEFNINSTKQLGTVLFDELKLPPSKKTSRGYSTDAEVLEKLKAYHPIIGAILDYRKVSKLRSTYALGLAAVADPEGRIHSSFNQKVTATGRLSSSEPNLQNIPIRTELGRRMREFFIAEDGYTLVDADYSQIELRVLAGISGDANMISSFVLGEDIHRTTASRVFGIPRDEVDPKMRSRAKVINFGIVYGMSAFTLADDIGVTRREAQDYINSYLSTYPEIRSFLDDSVSFASQNGYVTTLFGRRRYIPELSAGKKTIVQMGERIAKNSPVQGTAADIIKLAMINVADRLARELPEARLILQVHDELIIEAPKAQAEQAKNILREEMENAAEIGCPVVAECGTGDNWLMCH